MKSKFKEIIIANKHYIYIFLFAVIIFVPYISTNFIYGHDASVHLGNLFAIDSYISIENWTLLPLKIRPVLANNLGYGSGLFYPPFSYNTTAFIYVVVKQIGLSLISAVKIFEFLIVFFSGIFMYKFVNTTFKSKTAALASSLMYISAPYFCADVFVRMAYSEMAIFLFMPIVMLSITYLINKDYKKFMIFFVIGYSRNDMLTSSTCHLFYYISTNNIINKYKIYI